MKRLHSLSIIALILLAPAILALQTSLEEEFLLKSTTGTGAGIDFDAVDALLRGEIDATEDGYSPGDRRDPFASLLRAQGAKAAAPGCADGVVDLRIDDIEVGGVFETAQGALLQVRAVGQPTSLLLAEGDELCDGTLVSVSIDGAVFKQWVAEPDRPKPFRMVVKSFDS